MKKVKLFGGLGALLAGLVLVIYGIYGTFRMAEARGDIDSKTSLVPENPFKDVVKGGLNEKVDEYRLPVALCYIGGFALIIVGGVFIRLGRR